VNDVYYVTSGCPYKLCSRVFQSRVFSVPIDRVLPVQRNAALRTVRYRTQGRGQEDYWIVNERSWSEPRYRRRKAIHRTLIRSRLHHFMATNAICTLRLFNRAYALDVRRQYIKRSPAAKATSTLSFRVAVSPLMQRTTPRCTQQQIAAEHRFRATSGVVRSQSRGSKVQLFWFSDTQLQISNRGDYGCSKF